MIPQEVADIIEILEKHIDWCTETETTKDAIAWDIYNKLKFCRCD